MPDLAGSVFNIQKFSLHDGPGIRTVVFLKGCPLHCKWCANPESQSTSVQILWDAKKCLRCGACVRNCRQGAAEMREDSILINDRLCTGCRSCASVCPAGALEAGGEQKTVSQVVKVCLQDQPFYEESGGGVTLSGGEALMQPEFAAALARELKAHGIHTAMETTGYAEPEVFDAATADVGLLLFDIKHWNAEKHVEGTGVDNTRILFNMRRAISGGREVLPRLPVIPGYNDSLRDAAGFAGLLRRAGADKVQLLPFHQFGESKYALLGKQYSYKDVPALHEEDLRNFRQAFLDEGINAFF